MADESEIRDRLAQYGQEHLLHFWGALTPEQRTRLMEDIDMIDFPLFDRVFRSLNDGPADPDPDAYEVPHALPERPTADLTATYASAMDLGRQLIRGNRVAAMVVAGGQATRLGCDAPKGAFPIAPVSGKCLFQLFAESILATCRRYACSVPWYVMTSTANHRDTVALFERSNYFQLPPDDVRFFRQGMMPVADTSGKILLDQKHRVALAPNGHGGSLTALAENGVLSDMAERGVDYISYFQVDNPLVQPVDPLFLGLHAIERSEMSSLTIPKAADDEKVGQFVKVDGVLRVVEYTTFPETLARQRMPDGTRRFDQANIAVHVLNRRFVERIVGDRAAVALPWHAAKKAASHIDVATGERVTPAKPNAIKAEMFVFDALALARRPMLLRTTRSERFSPVKNLDGVDSVVTARRDMIRRAGAWLVACGVTVPRTAEGAPDCVLEISPLAAVDVDMLRERGVSGLTVARGASLLIE